MRLTRRTLRLTMRAMQPGTDDHTSLSADDRPKAVVLVSGGLDSATVLALCRRDGYATYALSFDYGQRHKSELLAAAQVAAALGAEAHRVMAVDLASLGGSALTHNEADASKASNPIPKDRDADHMGDDIPSTYVPARNTVFLSLALAWAEVLGARHLFVGANAVDYSGYPDCRPDYLTSFENMANLATRAGVEGQSFKVHAPLIAMSKADIIETGTALGVDYALTRSCYDPPDAATACGRCDSCILRLKGFAEAGLSDPVAYA